MTPWPGSGFDEDAGSMPALPPVLPPNASPAGQGPQDAVTPGQGVPLADYDPRYLSPSDSLFRPPPPPVHYPAAWQARPNYFPDPMQPVPQTWNGLAIAGFIVSLVGFPFFIGAVGLIMSIIGAAQCSKNPAQRGKGLAIAGIVIGALGAISVLLAFLLVVAIVASF